MNSSSFTDTTIRLITQGKRYQDANGIWRTGQETSREVLARVTSVGRSEFYAAGEAGMRAEYVFNVFPIEYQGETICEYGGKRYAIYRTYHEADVDLLELYVQREGGVSGGAKNND